MGIILSFMPFAAFAVLSGPLGAPGALIAGAAVSAALIVRGRLHSASPKILEIGTLVLFVALAIYLATVGQPMSVIGVRLCVDCGLLAIVAISMAVGQPFTLQYAREQVAREFWSSPHFVRANYIITANWAVAFLVMVIAEASVLFLPGVPQSVGIAAIVAALVGAVAFTKWYSGVSRASV